MSRPDRARGATIVDVAKLAGVSRMTVSRVIHNAASVRETTRDAVLAAIRELNYEPNLAARNLVMAGELRIGVIYSNPSAAFMSDFLIGVFEEATLAVPPGGHMQRGGRQGVHTEHLGYVLAEMQFLQRAYPNAQW